MLFIYEFFYNLSVAWEYYTSIIYLEYIPEFDRIDSYPGIFLLSSSTGAGYKTGNMRGYETGIICGYKANHSKKNCAGMTAIRPITRKFMK